MMSADVKSFSVERFAIRMTASNLEISSLCRKFFFLVLERKMTYMLSEKQAI